MDSRKVIIKRTGRFGRGVFAKQVIRKNEIIAKFDGPIYDGDFDGWTDDILNHAIQFGHDRWRDSIGIARLINHSCDPNCGIKRLFTVVAMRRIEKGEQITWDYEMTEKNDYGWRMKCKCRSPLCRKTIGDYRKMPRAIRKKYSGYISEWLTQAR